MPGRPQRRRSPRAWGWHPLRPEWAVRVVHSSPVRAGDLVLDLGAGRGALTAPLLERGARVVAVELHPGRAQALRERFGSDLTVVERDLRDLYLPRRPFRVVANPPYSLSTALLRTLLSADRMLSADLVLQRGAAVGLAQRPPRARSGRRYTLQVAMPVPGTAFVSGRGVPSAVLRVSRR